MSDSEDDYMSDKVLLSCQDDVRPGLVFNRTTKRQYELEKKRKEIEAKRPKNSREREEELREKGLNTAISSDNKGFKMLERMGFKQGQALGKSQSGLKEPIKIELRSGKSGVGTETHIKEKIKRKFETKDRDLKTKLNEFQLSNKMKQARRFLEKDFFTAQKACEDLDCRKDIEEPIEDFYWTRETIKKKRNIPDDEEEELDEFYEEFAGYTTEENLVKIIDYLRDRHLYCIFCAFVATDDEDLKTSCPGPYRSDHDEG